ncbi:MAG: hypothetical protein IT317_07170 [Anaerolineales bacterium]|nr:hypothetical protein [Anaerolineales bacterium]
MRLSAAARERLAAGGLLALAGLVYLWPLTLRPLDVPFAPGAAYTDLLISHLPNAAYLRDTLWQPGSVPLWNDRLFVGQPFAADPLAGVWYPPGWALLVLPLTLGFNLLLALHLLWGGLGVYGLARAEGASAGPALLAALTFTGLPKLVAHLAAGHVSLVFAVAWTPWLLLASRRAAQRGAWQAGAWAGAALAVTFLADVRWAYYAGALGLAYAVAQAWRQRPARRRALSALAGAAVLALLLAAPLAWPLAEFAALSRRAALTVAEAGALSLPPVYLLGVFIPDLGGFHEYLTYLGVPALLLALAGLGRRTLFWAAAALAAVVFALGANTPVYLLLFRFLPGVSLLRVPPRAWFIVGLAACLLAAHGAEVLVQRWLPKLRARPGAVLPLPGPRATLVTLMLLTGLDLLRVDSTLLAARPLPAVSAAAAWLAAQPGLFRVYSPSYSLPPGDGLSHLDGVDPLQLAATAITIERATRLPASGYSVTVPPFATTDLAAEHAAVVPDADWLGRLNVRYVAAEFDLVSPGLELAQRFGSTRVYQNTYWRERAWLDAPNALPVRVTEARPGRLLLAAAGPGLLVISEAAYPGWQARVDGRPAALTATADGLLALDLPAGAHAVEVVFRPRPATTGLVAALLGLGVLGIGAWPRRKVAA